MKDFEIIGNSRDPIELFRSNIVIQGINFQDNELRNIESKEVTSQAIRGFFNDKIGTARSAGNTDITQLIKMAETEAETARQATFSLPTGSGKPEIFHDPNPDQPNLNASDMIQQGNELLEAMKETLPDWNTNINIYASQAQKSLVNSRGVNRQFDTKCQSTAVTMVFAQEGDIIELIDGRDHRLDSTEVKMISEDLASLASFCMHSSELTPGSYPVLVHPMALNSLIEPLRVGTNAVSVFEGLSPLRNKIGTPIFDPRISILDTAVSEEFDFFDPFSDEGIVNKNLELIKDGVLMSYLSDLEYAARLGIECSGHGNRLNGFLSGDLPSANPFISGANWKMAPGKDSLEDLFSDIKTGLYLVNTWDVWSGTLINGDVSGSVHLGFLIKNGKIQGRIKDMRVSGNLYSMLKTGIAGLSKEMPDTLLGTFKSPYVLFKDLRVA